MEEISLWELLAIFKSRKKIITAVIIFVTMFGTLLGFIMPEKYISEFVFALRPLNDRGGFISLNLDYYQLLFESDGLLKKEPSTPKFSFEEQAGSGFFTVEVEGSSAEKAFDSAQSLFKNFIAINNEQLAIILEQYESAMKSEEEKLSTVTKELDLLNKREGSLEEAEAKNKNILNQLTQYSARHTETVTNIEASEKTLEAWEKDFNALFSEEIYTEILLPIGGETPNYILQTENLQNTESLEKIMLSAEYSKIKLNLSRYRQEEIILSSRIETLKNELRLSEADFLNKQQTHNKLTSMYSQTEANYQSLNAEKNELLLRLSDSNMEGNIQVIQKPVLPEEASSPELIIYFTLSFVIAVVIGLTVAIFIESYHKIKDFVSK